MSLKATIDIDELIRRELLRKGLILESIQTEVPRSIAVEYHELEKPFEVTDLLVKFFYTGDYLFLPDLDLIKSIIKEIFFNIEVDYENSLMPESGIVNSELSENLQKLSDFLEEVLPAGVADKTKHKFKKRFESNFSRIKSKDPDKNPDLKKIARQEFIKKYTPTFFAKTDEEIASLHYQDFASIYKTKNGNLYTKTAVRWKFYESRSSTPKEKAGLARSKFEVYAK
jgi:hypothetical protein